MTSESERHSSTPSHAPRAQVSGRSNGATDNIAVTLSSLAIHDRGAGVARRGHPYVVSLAIDAHKAATPAFDLNFIPFPEMRPGQRVGMLGDGHVLYGPKDPGGFVSVLVLVMNSSLDMTYAGDSVRGALEDSAASLAAELMLAGNPVASLGAAFLGELAECLAGASGNVRDSEVCRFSGSFLQDGPSPYDVGREYGINNYVGSLGLRVVSLAEPNGVGPLPEEIDLGG